MDPAIFRRKSQIFPTPCFCAPAEWVPLGIGYRRWGQKLEWWATRPNKKIDDIFRRVDTIHHVRDGRTARRTDTGRQRRPRLRIASRGKKYGVLLLLSLLRQTWGQMRIEGVQCLRFVCVSNITLWVELGEILWVDKLRCGKLLSVIRIIARNVYTGRSGLTDHRATGRPIVLPLSELYCPSRYICTFAQFSITVILLLAVLFTKVRLWRPDYWPISDEMTHQLSFTWYIKPSAINVHFRCAYLADGLLYVARKVLFSSLLV